MSDGPASDDSLQQRALQAVLLFFGFYVLAFLVVSALLGVLVNDWATGVFHPRLDAVCAIGTALILWSAMPRVDFFRAPGPELTREHHPKLFEQLDQIAAATGQEGPSEVYLLPDVNAWVTERGGWMGFGSRRVMGIGLPLLHVLTVKQLRAVLSHEFGHYVGGDTALGPWVYKARAGIGRTVENLQSIDNLLVRLLSVPFALYGNFFLRVSMEVSRAQEYAADALAAKLEGPRAMSGALERIAAAGLAMDAYLDEEFAPVVRAGYRPPFAQGFAAFVAAPYVARRVNTRLVEVLAKEKNDIFDTHPCTRDRMALMAELPDAGQPDDGVLASTLLGDLGDAESVLLYPLLGEQAFRMPPIAWDEVTGRVTLARMREYAARVALSGRFATLDVTPAALVSVAQRVAPGAPVHALPDIGADVVASAVLVRLVELGWSVQGLPGGAIDATLDGVQFAPMALLRDIAVGAKPPSAWLVGLRAAGLLQTAFGSSSIARP